MYTPVRTPLLPHWLLFPLRSLLIAAAIVAVSVPCSVTAQELDPKSLLKTDKDNAEHTDVMRELQKQAFTSQKETFARWGHIEGRYSTWTNHSNRLIPVYTFGIGLDSWRDSGSPYRSADRLKEIYKIVPEGTVNPEAEYYDQTDIYRLQLEAIKAGYRNIIVMVFDGMDWQTTRAAAIYKSGDIEYASGRGTGLAFQDYDAAKTDFGLVCTSANLFGQKCDTDSQIVLNDPKPSTGGYDVRLGGKSPWQENPDSDYLIGLFRDRPHTVADSAASATSLFAGAKTYNGAIGVSVSGEKLTTIAHVLQKQGRSIGLVTSVPLSHATPACAYAHNVNRKDYQDIARDLVGLPSSSHRRDPLPGVDVLIGGGWGESKKKDSKQGKNFLAGNKYLHESDRERLDAANGGKYIIAEREEGKLGRETLMAAAQQAAKENRRLLGFYGGRSGNLPFQTADGGFNPTFDVTGSKTYTTDDLSENPTLADMTRAALTYMETREKGFWLLVEAGDVDWANHANNIDNSIGAVFSGEAAFQEIVDWVEKKSSWKETALIVTADHGHYLVIRKPEMIADAGKRTRERAKEDATAPKQPGK